ncbi:MAG: NAD(+) diphosphatase [Micrococcaceae bacterium]
MRFSFSTRDIDRLSEWRVREKLFDDLLHNPKTRVIALYEDQFLVKDSKLRRFHQEDVTSAQLRVFLGKDTNTDELILLHVLSEAAALELRSSGDFKSFKEIRTALDSADQHLAIESLAITHWHDGHKYCPHCGQLTMVTAAGWSRSCLNDGRELFPKIEPSIMAMILNDKDEILLANDARWPRERYSLIAGFVDAGETLELALHREVKEEVGLELDNVTYLGDQAWPFPASQMFAFKGLAIGEVQVDGVEILDAKFFSRKEVQHFKTTGEITLPGELSMSAQLIDAWLNKEV